VTTTTSLESKSAKVQNSGEIFSFGGLNENLPSLVIELISKMAAYTDRKVQVQLDKSSLHTRAYILFIVIGEVPEIHISTAGDRNNFYEVPTASTYQHCGLWLPCILSPVYTTRVHGPC